MPGAVRLPPYARWLVVLALAGAALSAVSLVNHYTKSPTEYCSFDETFDCDVVNRSSYSRFLGVPVALIGLVGYAVLLGLGLAPGRAAAAGLLAASLLGLGFSLYLTYVEGFILRVWCVLCLGSLGVIVAITALSGLRLRRSAA